MSATPSKLLVAPYGAKIYQPHKSHASSEVQDKLVTFVGYGLAGTGATGATQPIDGRKRVGQNRIEQIFNDSKALGVDFDDGTGALDGFGVDYNIPNTGLGPAESSVAGGDSGGPWFVNDGGVQQIVGVTQAGAASSVVPANSKRAVFGYINYATRVDPYFAPFIEPKTKLHNYGVVLDMKYQIDGASNPTLGGVDNVAITAQVQGDNLELWLLGPSSTPTGDLIYSAPTKNITSLTIRGTNDNETISLLGSIGMPVFIEGGTGDDQVIVNETGSIRDGHKYNFVTPGIAGGYDLELARQNHLPDGSYITGPSVYSKDIEKYTLQTGHGADLIWVAIAQASLSKSLFIESNAGTDDIVVGAASMQKIVAQVFVDGGGDGGYLYYRDVDNAQDTTYKLTPAAPRFPNWDVMFQKSSMASLSEVFSRNITKYTIDANDGNSTIDIEYTSSSATLGNIIFANGGTLDKISIGDTVDGLTPIHTTVATEGGPGEDWLEFNDYIQSPNGYHYTISDPDQKFLSKFWDMQLLAERPQAGPRHFSDTVEKYTVKTGINDDYLDIVKSSASLTKGMWIESNGGQDAVTVGTIWRPEGSSGMDQIASKVYIDGTQNQVDTASLHYEDSMGTGPRTYIHSTSDVAGWDMMLKVDGGPQIIYSKFISHYLLDATRKNDIIQLKNTPSHAVDGTTIDGYLGDDRIELDGVTTQAPLGIRGSLGRDTIRMLSSTVTDVLLLDTVEVLDIVGGEYELTKWNQTFEDVLQRGGVLKGTKDLTSINKLTWTKGAMSGSGTTLAGGTVTISGPGPLLLEDNRTFKNVGAANWSGPPILGATGKFVNAGKLFPGGPDTLSVGLRGTFIQTGTGQLYIDLNGPAMPSDRIQASRVELVGQVTFTPVGTFPNWRYTIIDNSGEKAIAGQFAGVDENATVTLIGIDYKASYKGGDGNNFTLERIRPNNMPQGIPPALKQVISLGQYYNYPGSQYSESFAETHTIDRAEDVGVTIDQSGTGSYGTFQVVVDGYTSSLDKALGGGGHTGEFGVVSGVASGTWQEQREFHLIATGTFASGEYYISNSSYLEISKYTIYMGYKWDYYSDGAWNYSNIADTDEHGGKTVHWSAYGSPSNLTFSSYSYSANKSRTATYQEVFNNGGFHKEVTTYDEHMTTVGSVASAIYTGNRKITNDMHLFSPNPGPGYWEYKSYVEYNTPLEGTVAIGASDPIGSTIKWKATSPDSTNFTFQGKMGELTGLHAVATYTFIPVDGDWQFDVVSFESGSKLSDFGHTVEAIPGTTLSDGGTIVVYRDDTFVSERVIGGKGWYLAGSASAKFTVVDAGTFVNNNTIAISNRQAVEYDFDNIPYTHTFNSTTNTRGSGSLVKTTHYHDSGSGLLFMGSTTQGSAALITTFRTWGTRGSESYDTTVSQSFSTTFAIYTQPDPLNSLWGTGYESFIPFRPYVLEHYYFSVEPNPWTAYTPLVGYASAVVWDWVARRIPQVGSEAEELLEMNFPYWD